MTHFTESVVEEATLAWLAVNQCPAAEGQARPPRRKATCLPRRARHKQG